MFLISLFRRFDNRPHLNRRRGCATGNAVDDLCCGTKWLFGPNGQAGSLCSVGERHAGLHLRTAWYLVKARFPPSGLAQDRECQYGPNTAMDGGGARMVVLYVRGCKGRNCCKGKVLDGINASSARPKAVPIPCANLRPLKQRTLLHM